MSNQVKLTEEQKKLILQLFDEARRESEQFRRYLIPVWRRNEAFWNNIQRAVETEDGKNFTTTVADIARIADLPVDSIELYERIINIYRAHGESFISALSANLPNAVYSPDDADNANDISTAKAYSKITSLIQIKEEAPLKYIKLLYHLYNHGLGYIYDTLHQDKKYGVKKTPVIDYKTKISTIQVCPDCGEPREPLAESGMGSPDQMMAEPLPQPEMQMDPQQMMMPGMEEQQPPIDPNACPICGSTNPPVDEEVLEDIPYISSIDESPKGCAKIEVYGPLHVTVQPHVKKLDDSGYLILDTDLDKAYVRSLYPELNKKNKIDAGSDPLRIDRVPANSPYIDETNLCTVSRFWVRPWMFHRFDDLAVVDALKKAFKEGGYFVIINEITVVEGCDENLDECWTATESALSEKIHAEPYGNVMVPIQEMTNDLIALTMETIESEIPINFFDPSMLDAKEFKQRVARPGDFIPAKPRQGMGLESSIASTRPATLSKEVGYVSSYLEKMGQFVLGTLPSVFGGQQTGGSETLGEYKESRAQALQRLSLPYQAAASAWVRSMKKASTIFINYLIESDDDARYAKDLGNGNFINVWVKQVELAGKVGDVGVENSEQIPISYNQKRQMVMDLMMNAGQNPMLQSILSHPENVGQLASMFGLQDFYIPGDDDRDKQLREIAELIKGQASPGTLDPNTGLPGPEIPSVEPDFDVDNHVVHIEVIKAFLVSEVGQQLKLSNPAGYQNVVAHLQQHMGAMQPPPMDAEPSSETEMDNPNAGK